MIFKVIGSLPAFVIFALCPFGTEAQLMVGETIAFGVASSSQNLANYVDMSAYENYVVQFSDTITSGVDVDCVLRCTTSGSTNYMLIKFGSIPTDSLTDNNGQGGSDSQCPLMVNSQEMGQGGPMYVAYGAVGGISGATVTCSPPTPMPTPGSPSTPTSPSSPSTPSPSALCTPCPTGAVAQRLNWIWSYFKEWW